MNNVDSVVRDVFAEVTRYPAGILDPDAHLEDDLGIDSVKLGEIFAVLRERFQLPELLNIPPESLVTMGLISKALAQYAGVGENGHSPRNGHVNGHSNGHVAGHSAPVGNGAAGAPSAAAFLAQVQAVFAEVTRYPLEILDAHASLEEDLGIDSVKMGEVFAVLRERFSLPLELDVPPEKLQTLAAVAEALRTYVAAPAAAQTAAPAAPLQSAPVLSRNLAEEVQAIFAEVTRYPLEILDRAAGLEEDLGIDSVKLGEVFAVIRQRYQLAETLDMPRESLRTMNDIIAALGPHIAPQAPPAVEPPAAPFAAHSNGHKNQHTNGHSNGHAANAAGLYAYRSPAAKPFTGKVVFVSGSGRGLGKDIASYLAELGASVVVNSFHSRTRGEETAQEIRQQGGEALHLWGSMANPEHVGQVFDKIEAEYGGLDFFVGNASNGMLAKLEEITVEHWEKAFRTNIVGLHQSALRAAALMRRRGGGKIITLSSPAAHGYVDYFGCMGAVKAAVESLTRSMAIEFAPHNIQVNCVSPGPVYGELLDKWPDSSRLIKQWESNTAYTRLCEARDVSHFIAYLLSEPVKLFTGSVLVLDGGISSQGW